MEEYLTKKKGGIRNKEGSVLGEGELVRKGKGEGECLMYKSIKYRMSPSILTTATSFLLSGG